VAVGVCALVLIWLAAGLRQLEPEVEFGVLDGRLPGWQARRIESRWVVAPPGLFRLTRYPLHAVEIELPGALEAWVSGPDGGRYGYRGRAVLRVVPEAWKTVHGASAGRGLRGVLLDAVGEAPLPRPGRGEGRGSLSETAARLFRQSLSSVLRERGVELAGLELEGLDFLSVGPGDDSGHHPGTRLLIVGLDGADWTILDPLLEQGRLPNLERLIRDGVRANLLTITPMLSPVIWTTVATGVEPSRHGILDFLVPDGRGGRGQPVTSANRTAAALWQMLSRAGYEVGVVGWWASWPAEQVNGYVVSDRLAYQLFGYRSDADEEDGKVWPPELYETVRERIVRPEDVDWTDVVPYLSGTRKSIEEFTPEEQETLEDFRTLLASGRTYLDVTLALRESADLDFEAVYFEGTDTVGHLFMRYRQPRLPGVPESEYESFRDVVDRYYETADRYLGRLLEGRQEGWTVMVLSDHGFLTGDGRPRTSDSRIGHGAAAEWHRRFGMLVLSGEGIQAGAEVPEASVYDIAPTVMALFGRPVPLSWPGRVLGTALGEEFREAYPVRYTSVEPERGNGEGGPGADDPAARDLLDKLEALGYLGPGEDEQPSLTTRNNAGVVYMSEGRYAEAEAEFRAGLEDHPNHPTLLVNLGVTLRMQRKAEEAVGIFEQALQYPTARRAAGYNLAQIAMELGDLEDAEDRLREVLRVEPDAAEIRTTLGLILERRGDLAAAAVEYRRAAEVDPGAAVPRNNLGNLAKRDRDLEEAERWYREAIEADAYFMGAYNNLALVYQERGEVDRAIELYTRALEKAPTNAIVLNNLASLHYAAGNRTEAREVWERCVSADPAYPSPWNNLAGLAIAESRYEDAVRLLWKALELNPEYGDARINLALVHQARGRIDDARSELRRAAGDPDARRTAVLQLGLLELQQGNASEAIPSLEEARRTGGETVRVINALGEAYRRAGRTAEAIETWRRSLEIDPEQEALRGTLNALELDAGER
jgi:tetratricopeptide (TPR) repeat protein